MGGNRGVGVVVDGRVRTCYLCFIYTPVFTVSFVFRKIEQQEGERSAQVPSEFSF